MKAKNLTKGKRTMNTKESRNIISLDSTILGNKKSEFGHLKRPKSVQRPVFENGTISWQEHLRPLRDEVNLGHKSQALMEYERITSLGVRIPSKLLRRTIDLTGRQDLTPFGVHVAPPLPQEEVKALALKLEEVKPKRVKAKKNSPVLNQRTAPHRQ
jgi:hypothetical protein